MRNILYVLLCNPFFSQLVPHTTRAQGVANRLTISGYVREVGSQEALIGVNVYLPGTSTGTTTNTYGFCSLTLPAQDSLRLAFSFVGYQPQTQTVRLRTNATLNVALSGGQQLAEVAVRAKPGDEKVSESAQMSRIEVPIAQIKKIPAFLGEKDVLKVLQLMPGVQKGSEGQTGIYVRGGGPDQNLIILDDAIVYNASHLFGFYSTFNGDALKSVDLTKGGFPARYGGRLSSVIELNMKDGNREKLHGEGGIGLIASRLTLEGPFAKNEKGSFLVSGRRTYLDALINPLVNARTNGETQTNYYFYDLNAKANYDLGRNDKVYLSGYFGRDFFRNHTKDLNSKMDLNWGNATGTLRWNHLFGQKLFSNASLIFSDYELHVLSDRTSHEHLDDAFSLRYGSGIRDFSLKYDVDYYPTPRHSLRMGFQSIHHRFTPSAVVLKNTDAHRFEQFRNTINVLESGVYVEDDWRLTDRWRVNAGLRGSYFRHDNVTYGRPEPRFSTAYRLRPDWSIKASYALMNQYVHLLSGSGIGLPTDLWVPTTDRIRPQQSQQAAFGFAKDFTSNQLALTIEGYYKKTDNIITYKEGASFLILDNLNDAGAVGWEDNVTAGQGWSYGAEFLLQKKTGRFSGWAGYTLSWTQWQFDRLNGGLPFFPRYDRRHDVSLVGIYEWSKRVTLSGTWVYGTGNALTVPLGRYNAYQPSGSVPCDAQGNLFQGLFQSAHGVQDYGAQKNSFRAEAYHRFDVSLQFHKKGKRFEGTWEFSLYNAYNRRNPFFYQLEAVDQGDNQPKRVGLFRYSIFPVVPSCSYNFKF